MGMPFPTGLKRLEEWHAPSGALGLVAECRCQRAGLGGRAGVRHLSGLMQTLIIGGLFYLAALAREVA
jgi:hypothetical protein